MGAKQAGSALSIRVTCYGLRLVWPGSRSLSLGGLSQWAAPRLEFGFGEENQRGHASPNSEGQLLSRCEEVSRCLLSPEAVPGAGVQRE